MNRISVGFACNNACLFCAQGRLREREPSRDVEAQVALVERGEIVAFTGGEPTIHEALPAWIRAACERGAATVVVQTNGRRLAYRKYCDLLVASAAPTAIVVEVALQGSTKEMHDYHTSEEGSFVQAVRGLANARAAGLAAGVTTVVTRSNFRHLREIVALCRSLGVRAVRFATPAPFGRAVDLAPSLVASPALTAPRIAEAVAEAARSGLANDFPFAGVGDVELRESSPVEATPLHERAEKA